jgi:hypothetical protein
MIRYVAATLAFVDASISPNFNPRKTHSKMSSELSQSARFEKDNACLLGSLDTSTRLRTLERCFQASLVVSDTSQVLSNETGLPATPMFYLNEISKEFPMFSKTPSTVSAQKLIESLDTVLCAEETPVGSFRTLLLHGQLLEARQMFEQAFKLYEFARERSPANTAIVMREMCVLRQVSLSIRRRFGCSICINRNFVDEEADSVRFAAEQLLGCVRG